VDEWFNPNAFTEAVGHYGDIPRIPSGVSAPVNNPVTLAINRSFPLPLEGNHIDFRAEAFNALNHPQFGAPKCYAGLWYQGRDNQYHYRKPRAAICIEVHFLTQPGRPRLCRGPQVSDEAGREKWYPNLSIKTA